ncbi:hypothetical protein GCM10007962_13560 [Yeosuana aromativorans]|uniref:Uncharacterized protein n=1 Tax=Yeosuana aromativorans TaxID=288019 RepID=A0A8J3BGX0_9FLAO|nr:hypothetical protein GCM10007962_13560 [Yeosuana aromativorans]
MKIFMAGLSNSLKECGLIKKKLPKMSLLLCCNSNYLIALEKEGFLISEKVGKEKLYLNHRLMSILEQ